MSGLLGPEKLRAEALQQLLAHVNQGTAIPSDVRGVVYQLALLSGDKRAYRILKNMYLQVREIEIPANPLSPCPAA